MFFLEYLYFACHNRDIATSYGQFYLMSAYRITLKSVYSCPVKERPKGVQMPASWSLSWHQASTWEAVRDSNIDVIFNTAMTGDGKSLAAYLDTLQGNCYQLRSQGWRRVTGEITLHFIALEPSSKASETWLRQNSQMILAQFKQHPGSKGAIILNSIAAVKRLSPFFRQLLEPHGLTVGENTGLSGRGEKERSLLSDVVLGTSTIDVGVDFKINFLVFESESAGSFIQRLGRLGRHDGYERDGQQIKFEAFTTYALMPNFVVERLFLGDSPPLEPAGIYDRPFFHTQISDNYRKLNDFRGYYSRWGAVQSLLLCHHLGDRTIKHQYAVDPPRPKGRGF